MTVTCLGREPVKSEGGDGGVPSPPVFVDTGDRGDRCVDCPVRRKALQDLARIATEESPDNSADYRLYKYAWAAAAGAGLAGWEMAMQSVVRESAEELLLETYQPGCSAPTIEKMFRLNLPWFGLVRFGAMVRRCTNVAVSEHNRKEIFDKI